MKQKANSVSRRVDVLFPLDWRVTQILLRRKHLCWEPKQSALLKGTIRVITEEMSGNFTSPGLKLSVWSQTLTSPARRPSDGRGFQGRHPFSQLWNPGHFWQPLVGRLRPPMLTLLLSLNQFVAGRRAPPLAFCYSLHVTPAPSPHPSKAAYNCSTSGRL